MPDESVLSSSQHYDIIASSPRAKGVLSVLTGPYDPRVSPIVKFS